LESGPRNFRKNGTKRIGRKERKEEKDFLTTKFTRLDDIRIRRINRKERTGRKEEIGFAGAGFEPAFPRFAADNKER